MNKPKIVQHSEGPITVFFGKAEIAANGDVTQITVMRDGMFVRMTLAQAKSLANEILKRCA